MSLSLSEILAARHRIASHIKRTPVLTNEALDAGTEAQLFFKCENLQAAGAFKSRGACNAVFALGDAEAARGVVTHSSGNHGAAIARAARRRGIPGYVVMPHNAPATKVRNVESYGAKVVFCESSLRAREAECARIMEATGAVLVHPFDNFHVMAGQGTATLELLEDVPALDLVLCPVGGGGLLSGTAVAAKGTQPGIKVIGVEPELGDDVTQSFRARKRISIATPATIADGLRTNETGERNLPVILEHVDDMVTVSEEAIISAMRELWEQLKVVIEPSCAVPFAAIRSGRVDVRGKKVGIILTGGNVDLDHLPWLKS
jgi:threonine dehydratase